MIQLIGVVARAANGILFEALSNRDGVLRVRNLEGGRFCLGNFLILNTEDCEFAPFRISLVPGLRYDADN